MVRPGSHSLSAGSEGTPFPQHSYFYLHQWEKESPAYPTAFLFLPTPMEEGVSGVASFASHAPSGPQDVYVILDPPCREAIIEFVI
jgi:hypothetical protein